MKTSIIFSDGMKQIMLTPENDQEKFALQLITPEDNISLALKEGNLFDAISGQKPFAAYISPCQGGYLRAFTDERSIMLVLSPKIVEPSYATDLVRWLDEQDTTGEASLKIKDIINKINELTNKNH